MICPMVADKTRRYYGDGKGYPPAKEESIQCAKESCAWWSEEMGQCDPTGLLPWFKHIEGHLAKLAGKSPHRVEVKPSER